MNRRLDLAVLAGWTLLVWVGRVRNVVADDALAGWALTWRVAVSVAFTTAAIVLAVSLVRTPRLIAPPQSLSDRLGVGLAVIGIAWWLVRGTGILLADHSAGFKLVHTVLALVTVALSAAVLRASRRSDSPRPTLATS